MSHKLETKDIMTSEVLTIIKGQSLFEADLLMKEHRIRHLPVVDSSGSILGVLSSRDFSYLADLRKHNVETFMSVPVEWVEQKTPLRTIILRMIEKKISCLLIGDEKKKLLGLITSEDLLWILASRLEKDEDKHSPWTLLDVQSLEEIANQISLAGL